jgi:hypothetical protein
MKKGILFFLLIAGTVSAVHAQNRYPFYEFEPGRSEADLRFNSPRPGKAKANFHFFNVNSNGIRFTLELYTIKQLYRVPNFDSILTVAKSNLKVLADSLKEDGIQRRVDVIVSQKSVPQIRITNHNTAPSTFAIKNGELNVLKTGQDTLRIMVWVPTGEKQYVYDGDMKRAGDMNETRPVFLTFILNNISDIYLLTDDMVDKCLQRLKQDISEQYVNSNPAYASYTAYYNLKTSKMFSPSKIKHIKWGQYRDELVPNIYGSLQFARGSFVPSMAAGLRYSNYRNRSQINRFFLMWDPYFFFSKDANNRVVTDRNDFITFRYTETEAKQQPFDYVGNFSLGYLVGRKGDWFEKNTFKFGLPAVRSGWLQLEPEFYFNNFFKNFSPTIKLTIHYE